MKILIVMDPGIMIPVKGYGGHERLVEMFAKQYLKMGHQVHLLITTGSYIEGCTVHDFGKEGFPPLKSDARNAMPSAWKFLWKHRNSFDMVHNFGRLAYLLPILHQKVKKIMTYGREISSTNIRIINKIGGKNIVFTACSGNLLSRVKAKGNWEVVYNAINFLKYNLTTEIGADAPLIFLGRIEKVKGCHTAIKVAKATGSKLIIAGNISPLAEEKDYFEKEIVPHIDGTQIKYIGPVNDLQKNEWLGKCKAMLFPIEWNEPFGIVMIEAMACGTPVLAFNAGSVNEVIDEGITGFKIATKAEMIDAIGKLSQVSRAECRQQAMKRFDVKIIASCYLNIIDNNRKKILILSTHQPAGNPRAMKEYETLKELGHWVKLLYAYNADWSYKIDEEKFNNGQLVRQDFIELGGNPHNHSFTYFISRLLHRIFMLLSNYWSFAKEMSMSKTAFDLWLQVKKYPAHLYIAHYLGALPAAEKAAKKFNAKLVFDAEDFHRGEQSYYDNQIKNVIEVEDKYLPEANAITAASPLIAKAYKNCYPKKSIININNAFSKRFLQPRSFVNDKVLKLFWFSQNIGTNRGLEVFIDALNYLPEAAISLTIMGNNRSVIYQQELLLKSNKPKRIIFKNTVAPEKLFDVAANYDVGLAGEVPNCLNKEICLSNKIFTYLLAGNCILASDMPGQKQFIELNPGIGFSYIHDDSKDLASKIELLYKDRALLESCKQHAVLLSEMECNWEHEKDIWLHLVKELLDDCLDQSKEAKV